MSRKTFSLSFLKNPELDLSILNQHKLQAFLTNFHFHPNKYKQKRYGSQVYIKVSAKSP